MSRPLPEPLKIVALPVADRIDPPGNLTAAERKLFIEIVSKCPPHQFSLADVYLFHPRYIDG